MGVTAQPTERPWLLLSSFPTASCWFPYKGGSSDTSLGVWVGWGGVTPSLLAIAGMGVQWGLPWPLTQRQINIALFPDMFE